MHVPVLKNEVIQYLDPKPNENFVDCTLGGAGHALAILAKTGPNGKVLGIDADPGVIRNLELEIRNFKKRIVLVNDNFANLGEIVKNAGFNRVNGILFDLGISSWDLEGSGRGFSFLKNEPLDMRYGSQNQLTAGKIVNYWSAKDLERILTEYGEERFSREIAAGIISFRQVKPIETTLQMVEIVRKAIPYKYQRQKINPATLTFQALRIAVNDELNNLKNALPQALEILKSGGRIAVISFHSLEDRIVKTFFRDKSKEGLLNILTKKPITPSFEELRSNPRSRSAKLRAVIKI